MRHQRLQIGGQNLFPESLALFVGFAGVPAARNALDARK